MEEELKNTGSSLLSLVDEAEADKERELSVSTLEPQQEQVTRAVDQSQKETSLLQTPTTINPELEQPQEGKSALNKSIFATTPLAIPSAIGLGVVDFGIDVATKLTGQEQLDDKWDRITKFDNPWAQRLRNFSSVAIPTFIPVVGWAKYVNALKLPALTSAMAHIGGAAAIDAAVIGFSDMG